MKKKIALMLAAVMTLSSLPMSLFAASSNTVINNPYYVPEKTIFVQTPGDPNLSYELNRNTYATSAAGATVTAVSENDRKYAVRGAELTFNLENEPEAGTTFTIALQNAEFQYRGDLTQEHWNNNWQHVDWVRVGANGQVTTVAAGAPGAKSLGYYTGADHSVLLHQPGDRVYYYLRAGYVAGTTTSPDFSDTKVITDSRYLSIRPNDGANYDKERGTWAGSTAATRKGGTFYNGMDSEYGTIGGMNGEVYYEMYVSESDPKLATVTIRANTTDTKVHTGTNPVVSRTNPVALVIPMIARTTANSDVVVTVNNVNSVVTGGSYVIGSASGNLTTTYTSGTLNTGKYDFTIPQFIIRETRYGSLQNGFFRLTLPTGFVWTGIDNAANLDRGTKLVTVAEPGLPIGAAIYARYLEVSGTNGRDIYENILVLEVTGIDPKSISPGLISIQNLRYYADENAPMGDVMAKIENEKTTLVNGKFSSVSEAKVSTLDIKVGTRADWGFNFKLETTPIELVNGRYIGTDSGALIESSNDYHYVGGAVIFQETAPNTWHAQRTTTFTLPEWVKVRKLQIYDYENMNSSNVNTGTKTVTVYTLNSSGTPIAGGSEVFGNEFHPNDSLRRVSSTGASIMVSGNEVTLNNLSISPTARGRIRMRYWLSIESGMEGEITLTAAGSALRELEGSVPVAVIAKSVNPANIETSVTDVRIGLQYQTTADVRITETAAGRLLRGKTLKLSLSDQIGDDLVFTPGYRVETEVGDIKLKEVRTTGNGSAASNTLAANGLGTITLDIAAASTKASTILYSNLQVKVSRDVPQSNYSTNKDFIGYDVVAWGTAIAENYSTKGYANAPYADTFQTAGISAPYLRVVTTATGKDTTLSTVVKVAIGSNEILVGGKVMPIDDPAYVSSVSGSTMIPLRAVSVALGIDESTGVIWDQAKQTATILNAAGGVSVAFKLGSSDMIVNGNSVPMLSPDGKPVVLEVKNDRIFIPFRALGNAFGIPVSWDQEQQTAIYNADLD